VQLNAREATKVLSKVHGAELIDFDPTAHLQGAGTICSATDVRRLCACGLHAVDMNRKIRVRIPIRLAGVCRLLPPTRRCWCAVVARSKWNACRPTW
jgi:hypothetical protein